MRAANGPILSLLTGTALQVVFTKLAESSWRTLLFWIGPPGLVIAGLALLTLAEPRTSSTNFVTSLMNSLRPKPKSQVPTEDMVTATQYSRVWSPLLEGCIPALQMLQLSSSPSKQCIPQTSLSSCP